VRFPPIYAAGEQQDGPLANPDPPARRVGYAVVGLGRFGLGEIIPTLTGECKHSRLVALVTGDAAKGRTVAQQYGVPERSVYGYADYDRIANDPAIEVVYVALPNSMHAEYVVRGAKAGKHVFCEKPMATSVAECEQMIAACKQAGRELMVGYRIQYEPHNRLVQRMVRGRELGQARLIEMVNNQNQGDPNHWRMKKALAGGGSLPDVGIYCYNTARFLTGEEPVEIRAMIQTPANDPRFREVEDTVLWQMRFPSGTVANCATSYSTHRSRRYRVNFEDGWAEMDPAFAYSGLRLEIGRALGTNASREQRQLAEQPSQFAREIDHFSERLRAGQRPYTPGEEALQDQRVQDAIYRAAREGRPVTLPPGPKLDAFRGAPPQEG
jgi:predicted dehydrogenase